MDRAMERPCALDYLPGTRPRASAGEDKPSGSGRAVVGQGSARLPGWPVTKPLAEIEALLDSLGMPSCLRCGAVTDRVDPVCYPCRSGNRSAPPYGSRRDPTREPGRPQG